MSNGVHGTGAADEQWCRHFRNTYFSTEAVAPGGVGGVQWPEHETRVRRYVPGTPTGATCFVRLAASPCKKSALPGTGNALFSRMCVLFALFIEFFVNKCGNPCKRGVPVDRDFVGRVAFDMINIAFLRRLS